jgi:hypothetical protein
MDFYVGSWRRDLSGVFNKDVKVPLHEAELVGTSSSNNWYTTAQWRNQFPENSHIDTQQTLKSIKANSTPHDDLHYCPNWLGPQKKGSPKKDKRKMSIADYVQQSAKKKRKTTAATKTPEEERVDLEGKDVKDGQEGKA